eukprot:s831_g15.t1
MTCCGLDGRVGGELPPREELRRLCLGAEARVVSAPKEPCNSPWGDKQNSHGKQCAPVVPQYRKLKSLSQFDAKNVGDAAVPVERDVVSLQNRGVRVSGRIPTGIDMRLSCF